MPMIIFECNNPDCDNNITKLYKAGLKIPPFLDCGACGTGKLERRLSVPSTMGTQIVDNGSQPRQTEVMNAVVDKESDRFKDEE